MLRIASSLLELASSSESDVARNYDLLMDITSADLALVIGPGAGVGSAVEGARLIMAEAVLDLLQEQIGALFRKSHAVAEMERDCFPADEDEEKRVWAMRQASWELSALVRGMGNGGAGGKPDTFWGSILLDIFRLGVRVGRRDKKVAAAVFVLLADVEDQLDQSMRTLQSMFPDRKPPALTHDDETGRTLTNVIASILKRETADIKDRVRKEEEGEQGEQGDESGMERMDVAISPPVSRGDGIRNPVLVYMDDIDIHTAQDSEEGEGDQEERAGNGGEEDDVQEIRAFL